MLTEWRKRYPDEFFVPLEKRTTFHPHEDYPEHLHNKIYALCQSRGFVRDLPPAPGGIEAIQEMLSMGHDVRFCSSHLLGYDPSVLEKYQWIENTSSMTVRSTNISPVNVVLIGRIGMMSYTWMPLLNCRYLATLYSLYPGIKSQIRHQFGCSSQRSTIV